MTKQQMLIILDLDETLVFGTKELLDSMPNFTAGEYHIYVRPHFESFIRSLSSQFRLAIWSSATDDYVFDVVENLISEDINLEFVWARSNCKVKFKVQVDEYGYYDANPRNHYYYVKPLKKVKRRGFPLERVLIVDDTVSKSEENYGNVIYPKPYFGDKEDNELLALLEYLQMLKEVDNVREIEKRGWRNCL
ncbi:HAD family hydrolase [Limibacter armeniacum]|uniref:HAD family hydrolase n=1 Tax=Limibacter armeniacum TaxID=466084 RepID=UPI002FE6B1F5